jgi:hypothetical protein
VAAGAVTTADFAPAGSSMVQPTSIRSASVNLPPPGSARSLLSLNSSVVVLAVAEGALGDRGEGVAGDDGVAGLVRRGRRGAEDDGELSVEAVSIVAFAAVRAGFADLAAGCWRRPSAAARA